MAVKRSGDRPEAGLEEAAPHYHGHRERLRARFRDAGSDAVTDYELLELVMGKGADAPLCFTCGTKMRPAGSCYVCEGCGSTSGCS